MLHFENDYNAMCHPIILEKMAQFATLRMSGYGDDEICKHCIDMIRKLCENASLSVHFLAGGTQSNLITITASLRPYQCVIAAESAHIFEHETGAIEAGGHKILTVPAVDGKITAMQIERVADSHFNAVGPEHTVQPKLVYISFSTELGTIYTKAELEAIRAVCDQYGLFLYIDGARLGYGLAATDCDVTIADIARLSDAFYIGGTKQGLLYGEAVVISNPAIAMDFRYMVKQRGGMLAKTWLVALQFLALLEDDLYFTLAKQANSFADEIRGYLLKHNVKIPVSNRTNQVFAILPEVVLNRISRQLVLTDWARVDSEHRMVRFCTSWSTTTDDINNLKIVLSDGLTDIV